MYYLEIDPALKAHSLPQALGDQKKNRQGKEQNLAYCNSFTLTSYDQNIKSFTGPGNKNKRYLNFFFFFLVFVLLEESEVPMERNSQSLKNIYHADTQLTGGFSCPLFYSCQLILETGKLHRNR